MSCFRTFAWIFAMLAQVGMLLQTSASVIRCVEATGTQTSTEIAMWCDTSANDLPAAPTQGWHSGLGACMHECAASDASRRLLAAGALFAPAATVNSLLIAPRPPPPVSPVSVLAAPLPPLLERPSLLLI